MSVWVEVALAGDVSQNTAELAVDRLAVWSRRFGLSMELGKLFYDPEFPGTDVLLDAAGRLLAEQMGVPVEEARRLIAERARVQEVPQAA